MATSGQVIAAAAGGALLMLAAVLAVKLRAVQRQAEQERRIDTAVRAVLGGLEAHRQAADDEPPDAEAVTKAHLRLVVPPRAAPPPGRRPGRRGPGEGRTAPLRRR